MPQRSCAIPVLHLRDAPAAIDWLCRVFGFERHLVVEDDGYAARDHRPGHMHSRDSR